MKITHLMFYGIIFIVLGIYLVFLLPKVYSQEPAKKCLLVGISKNLQFSLFQQEESLTNKTRRLAYVSPDRS